MKGVSWEGNTPTYKVIGKCEDPRGTDGYSKDYLYLPPRKKANIYIITTNENHDTQIQKNLSPSLNTTKAKISIQFLYYHKNLPQLLI